MYLGIDIGGTKIAGGLVTAEGRVVRRDSRLTPAQEGGARVLQSAIALARGLMTPDVRSVGVGAAGQVDTVRGIVVHASELLPGWTGTPIKAVFEGALGLTTHVENDVNALAVGEARFGAARGLATVVFLALGTGVGGALLLGGRVHHGAHWSGGELGSLILTLEPDARQDASGRGTLEAYASGPALVQTWREMTGETAAAMTGRDIGAGAMRDPESDAARAVAKTGEYLGWGLVSLANVLDPDVFVIGGGLASLGEALLGPARRVLQAHALPGPAACPVVPAALGPDAALVGAAALAMPAAMGE